MKIRTALFGVALLASFVFFPCALWAADQEKSSSMQMMERAEMIVYGEPGKGGLIERLNSIEKELFGRELPGSISERHTAILNFLEIGTPEQPSMLFKLGVAEWLVGQTSQVRKGALTRVENLETELDGTMQYGRPLAMRVERLLASLVADPVTFQEVVLPTATVLRLQFLEELSPARTKKGDLVNLTLTNDLLVGKVLVAPKGSLIDTVVSDVKQPRSFGIPSEIRFDFRSLIPLGPQRPRVALGAAAKKATDEAQKGKDKGEGGIIGAAGASLGGALLLGPLGLPAGLLVRGNAVKIPQGTIMFLETSGDVRVSGYPVPDSLRIDPNATVRETISAQPNTGDKEIIELPAEQRVN
ncbi:MAG: hypothetical protein FWG71_00240 [Synergistaceae bacterium]|nr:hypothetical protein [Synergistaceae bacterium]